MAKTTGVVTNVNVTREASRRLRVMARERGMLIYRTFDLLLEGWDMLTEEQRHEAHRRVFSGVRRQPQAVA